MKYSVVRSVGFQFHNTSYVAIFEYMNNSCQSFDQRVNQRSEDLRNEAENFASMANELVKTMESRKKKWWKIWSWHAKLIYLVILSLWFDILNLWNTRGYLEEPPVQNLASNVKRKWVWKMFLYRFPLSLGWFQTSVQLLYTMSSFVNVCPVLQLLYTMPFFL